MSIGRVEVALERIRSPRVSEALQTLLVDAQAGVSPRANAAWLLGRLRCLSAVQALIETLADGDAYLRYKVVEALKVLKDRRAIEPIQALLNDEDRRVREEAALALKALRAPSIFETISTHALEMYAQKLDQLVKQTGAVSAKLPAPEER